MRGTTLDYDVLSPSPRWKVSDKIPSSEEMRGGSSHPISSSAPPPPASGWGWSWGGWDGMSPVWSALMKARRCGGRSVSLLVKCTMSTGPWSGGGLGAHLVYTHSKQKTFTSRRINIGSNSVRSMSDQRWVNVISMSDQGNSILRKFLIKPVLLECTTLLHSSSNCVPRSEAGMIPSSYDPL